MTLDFRAMIEDDISTVVDGLETITVHLDRTVPENVMVTFANRSDVKRNDKNLGDVTTSEDKVSFVLQANLFVPVTNPAEIFQRDLITDASGAAFIVESANLAVVQTVWQVVCTRKRW